MAIYIWKNGDEDLKRSLFDSYVNPLELAFCIPHNHHHHHQRRHQQRQQPAHQKHELAETSDDFKINMDVQHFKPEEITVKVADNCLVIEAKHEEKNDEHGSIYRHFVRRCELPEGYNSENIVSKLSSDGVLTVRAPKISNDEEKERIIPITHTGPHRVPQIDDKKKE